MDLTHWHLNAIARKRNLQQPPECCREAAKEAIEAAYQAGWEDAAKAIEAERDRWESLGYDDGGAWVAAVRLARGQHTTERGSE